MTVIRRWFFIPSPIIQLNGSISSEDLRKSAISPSRYPIIRLSVVTRKPSIDKEWFIQNTDISDWASFFRDYNVFKFVDFKKDWSGKHIRSMRELINAVFPTPYIFLSILFK